MDGDNEPVRRCKGRNRQERKARGTINKASIISPELGQSRAEDPLPARKKNPDPEPLLAPSPLPVPRPRSASAPLRSRPAARTPARPALRRLGRVKGRASPTPGPVRWRPKRPAPPQSPTQAVLMGSLRRKSKRRKTNPRAKAKRRKRGVPIGALGFWLSFSLAATRHGNNRDKG